MASPDGLLYGDNLRWMFEARRAASGELVYRDFGSIYAPLGIMVTSIAHRWFVAVTNGVIDLIGEQRGPEAGSTA